MQRSDSILKVLSKECLSERKILKRINFLHRENLLPRSPAVPSRHHDLRLKNYFVKRLLHKEISASNIDAFSALSGLASIVSFVENFLSGSSSQSIRAGLYHNTNIRKSIWKSCGLFMDWTLTQTTSTLTIPIRINPDLRF